MGFPSHRQTSSPTLWMPFWGPTIHSTLVWYYRLQNLRTQSLKTTPTWNVNRKSEPSPISDQLVRNSGGSHSPLPTVDDRRQLLTELRSIASIMFTSALWRTLWRIPVRRWPEWSPRAYTPLQLGHCPLEAHRCTHWPWYSLNLSI